jgi:hypothetical protein
VLQDEPAKAESKSGLPMFADHFTQPRTKWELTRNAVQRLGDLRAAAVKIEEKESLNYCKSVDHVRFNSARKSVHWWPRERRYAKQQWWRSSVLEFARTHVALPGKRRLILPAPEIRRARHAGDHFLEYNFANSV